MRQRDGQRHVGQVDDDLARILGVGVGLNGLPGPRHAPGQIGARHVVDGEDAVLRARLDGHVRDGQAAVHGDLLHAIPAKLQRHVARAVHADEADQVEDDILAADVRVQLARERHLYGLGHLEPGLAGRHAGGHVRGAHAGGHAAQRAVGTGMAVRADDDLARRAQALLGQQRVLDAGLADLEVVDDLLLARKGAHGLGHLRGLDVLVGREVIRHQHDLRGVKDLLGAHLVEFVDRHRPGDVVAQHQVEVAHEELARPAAFDARGARKDFLGHGHAHEKTASRLFHMLTTKNPRPCVRRGEDCHRSRYHPDSAFGRASAGPQRLHAARRPALLTSGRRLGSELYARSGAPARSTAGSLGPLPAPYLLHRLCKISD